MNGCRPLTEEEVAGVVQSFGGKYAARDRALFLLGIKTGYRIRELLSLKVKDVYQAGRITDTIIVARRNRKCKKTGHSVPLHPVAREALQDWLARINTEDVNAYVFCGQKGDSSKPITEFQAWRILKEVYRDNHLTGKLGTHSMRKTFADRVPSRDLQ